MTDYWRVCASAFGVSILLGACTARIDGPAGGSSGLPTGGEAVSTPEAVNGPQNGDPGRVAPARMRRLTPTEVRNSIEDVWFGGGSAELSLPDDAPRHDFDNAIAGLQVDLGFAETMQAVAERASAGLVPRLTAMLPCSLAIQPANEPSCLSAFLDQFGTRTYRRPLFASEADGLKAVFVDARMRHTFGEALGVVAEAMLQAPGFLYRTELGQPGQARSRLGRFESASALSYFVWRSAPDDQLLAAARAGQLAAPADLQKEATRLLAAPRARGALHDFFFQWLELNQVAAGVQKADPAFTPALATAMLEESRRFIDQVLWSGDGSLASLLKSTSSFVNGPVGALYGKSGLSDTAFTELQLDPTQRAGLLTQPAFLAAQSSPSGFSPIFPGLFVRRKLFCQTLPAPPPGVPAPSKDPTLSARQRFATHSDSVSCQGCHRLIDPIGFGFERYDALGRYRQTERVSGAEVPLTGEGTLVETDVDGAFTGVPALAALLAQSNEVNDCFRAQLMRFMLGRETTDPSFRVAADTESLAAVSAGQAGVDVKQLIVALVGSPSFLYRDATGLPVATDASSMESGNL